MSAGDDDPEAGPKDLFLASLARCVQGGFADRFYERFLATSPDVRDKFASTNFERQKPRLVRSLELIAAATEGRPTGLRELHERAETHSRRNLNIQPELYDLWLDAAISTAAETDPTWSPTLEAAWRQILGVAIWHMVKEYDRQR